jgi:hypothetical protein
MANAGQSSRRCRRIHHRENAMSKDQARGGSEGAKREVTELAGQLAARI